LSAFNPDRRSRNVLGAMGEALRPLPTTARQTITFDRSHEAALFSLGTSYRAAAGPDVTGADLNP
jgi:IS30 family transposase